MPYGLPDGSHTRMKVKKTYRLEQETIEELEKLCSDSGKSATEVIEGAIHDAIHVPDVERIGDGWAQTVAALTDQLAVKDDQIASLGASAGSGAGDGQAPRRCTRPTSRSARWKFRAEGEPTLAVAVGSARRIGFCGKIHGCPEHGTPAGIDHRITSEGCFQSIGANMKIEVEFCKSETAILEAAFEQHRDELREHWAVDTMADMVKLLAMHGLDSLEGLAGLGDTISE